MRSKLSKTAWDYAATVPNWLEIAIWIVVMIALLTFVIGIIYCLVSITRRILGIKVKDVDIKLKPKKLENKHQLEIKELAKQETKEFNNCIGWQDKLFWAFRWRTKELLKVVVVVLVLVIFGLLLFFNFTYSKESGPSLKPTVKVRDVIKK